MNATNITAYCHKQCNDIVDPLQFSAGRLLFVSFNGSSIREERIGVGADLVPLVLADYRQHKRGARIQLEPITRQIDLPGGDLYSLGQPGPRSKAPIAGGVWSSVRA